MYGSKTLKLLNAQNNVCATYGEDVELNGKNLALDGKICGQAIADHDMKIVVYIGLHKIVAIAVIK